MIFYFDTSALVKLVVKEDGSGLAGELWDSADISVSSILSYPEGRAAMAAARRQGRLKGVNGGEALATFESLQDELVTVAIDDTLARSAGRYADDLGLPGYDAVHIASALQLEDDEVVVVTWDRDLAKAAERVGLGVAGLIS